MQAFRIRRVVAVLMALVVAATVSAGEIQSTMRSVSGSYEAQGYRLEPAYDVQIPAAARDLAGVQVFELIRPDNRPVTIGRMFTSCSCIQLEAPKKVFESGERILLQLHNIRATPPAGQVYAVFVQITRPIRVTLRIDTFVSTGTGLTPATSVTVTDTSSGEEIASYEGANNELAALLSSVDTTRAESTGDLVESGSDDSLVQLPEGLDNSDGDDAEEGETLSVGEEPEADVEPPEALGTADLAQDVDESVEASRQAMDSYFQGDDGEAMGGDLPDFYGQDSSPSEAEQAEGRAADVPDTLLPPQAQAQLEQLQAQIEAQTGRPVVVAPVQVAPAAVLEPQGYVAPVQAPTAQSREAAANWPVQAVTLITVGVRDMPAAVRFYEALGLPRAARGKYDQTAFFQLSGQVLALYPLQDLLQEQNMEGAAPAPGGITLALHVREKADVWTLYQRFIDAGGTSLRVPAEMASGAVSCYVADPDGNPWEISFVPQFRIDENGGLWLP